MDDQWMRATRAALAAGDESRLASLFAAAVTEVGEQEASRLWLSLASGLDSSAVTG